MERKRVVGAVIYRGNKILIAQRNSTGNFPGEWEFPGGKVQPGESDEIALKREIVEELGGEIEVQKKIKEITHDYPNMRVQLAFYLSSWRSNQEPKALEHKQLLWIAASELKTYTFLEADLPILEWLKEEFKP